MLCGDFNEPPLSYTYRTLCKERKDTFKERGHEIGFTYAGSVPLLRIDYILTDPRFDVLDFDIIKERYSDHYPLKSVISLKKDVK